MNAIPVEVVGRIRTSRSPLEAIRASERLPHQQRARRDSAHLEGSRVVDAWCSLREWAIEFSGPVWLRVTAARQATHASDAADLVDWVVARERPDVVAVPQPVEMDWPGGATTATDASQLAAACRDAGFQQLWADDVGLLVYVAGHRILSFHAVRRRDTGDIVLRVSETE